MTALILLLYLATCSSALADDWSAIPLETSADLYAIENTVLSNRWVVGAGGFAARSNVDRTAWTTQDPGTNADLFTVWEPGGLEVYMGAGSGVVRLKVYSQWFERDLPVQADFRLFTRRGAKCAAIGAGGVIFVSTNAGNTWNPRQSGTVADLNAGSGMPDGAAWIVGNGGTILRTADGNTWNAVASGTTADLHGIAELDFTTLYVVGDGGTILKSTDAGLSWTPRPSGTTNALRAISISKQNATRVIAVGLGGTVLRSTDAGNSWCHLSVTTADLYAAEAVSNTEFLVAGEGGLFLRTTNGGGSCVAPVGVDIVTLQDARLKGPFPQPSTTFAMLRVLVGDGQSLQTQVFDPSGRLVLDAPEIRAPSAGEQTIRIDTGNLGSGVYLVTVRSDEFRATRRLVVTR